MNVLGEFKNKVNALKNKDNYRFEATLNRGRKNCVLIENKSLISFASNDYLNLSFHKDVISTGIKALKECGASSSSSKFIEGYSPFYEEIKRELKVEDCLIFNSGYMANLGIMQAIFTKEDIIFLDENAHASSFEGAKLSGAKIIRYTHNLPEDLELKLQKFSKLGKKIGIATETVFSMQGSVLRDVEKYFEIAKNYEAIFITDEAHSFGVIPFSFPQYDLHIKMGTFSKSVGVLGGYVSGNSIIIDYIRQFAKTGIYTTALPPSILASILASLKLINSGKISGKKALLNAQYFAEILDVKQESQIIFLETSGNEEALKLSQILQEEGFFVKVIRKPTVKNAGLRFSFNNNHKKVDIKKLAFIMKENLN
jgi:8-amino-7-oxononanoate synthase